MNTFYTSIWILTICCLGIFGGSSFGQSAEEEVALVIQEMFDGMRAGDSSRVHKVFAEEVAFFSSARRKGSPVLFKGSLDRFLNSVGTPHSEVYDERISGLTVDVDQDLATAWMNYSFYLGEEFSHCGINTMTLHNSEEGWKIFFIADTRRKENCLE